MHTSVTHTLRRNGTIYVNRRVPPEAKSVWGNHIRIRVPDEDTASKINQRLTYIWATTPSQPFDIRSLIASTKPKATVLSSILKGFLEERDIATNHYVRATVDALIALSGDLPIPEYSRDDARAFVHYWTKRRANKTGSVRRRLDAISAVFNYGFSEHDINQRNPFARIRIKNEGIDATKRQTYTQDELTKGCGIGLNSCSQGRSHRLLFPLLAETGCRLGEVLGAKTGDINLQARTLMIQGNELRRLKTKGSSRVIPLVGSAFSATEILLKTNARLRTKPQYLFPQYVRNGKLSTSVASSTFRSWVRAETGNQELTAHGLRHTLRDRLRKVEAPLELIDQIGGWKTVSGAGTRYGRGYDLEQLRRWLLRIAIKLD